MYVFQKLHKFSQENSGRGLEKKKHNRLKVLWKNYWNKEQKIMQFGSLESVFQTTHKIQQQNMWS